MAEWLDRTVQAARGDPEVVRELERVRDLERQLLGGFQMSGGIMVDTRDAARRAATSEGRSGQEEYELLLDRLAVRLAKPGENPAELAQWLSYHCEDVLEHVGRADRRGGLCIRV